MEVFEQAAKIVREFVAKNPHLKSEASEFYQLFLDECEDDATSKENELSLLLSDLQDLQTMSYDN